MKLSAMVSSHSSAIRNASHSFTFPSSLRSISSLSSPLQNKYPISISVSRRSSFPGNSVSMKGRNYSVVSAAKAEDGAHCSSFQGGESFFRSVLASIENVYLTRNPTAKAVLDTVHSAGEDRICYDHIAFRTFGVNGHGIDSIASFFLDYGYTQREELRFPAKKLKALWFSPPSTHTNGASGINGPLPRIFISQLLVDQMSAETQEIIRKYTETSASGNKYAALASSLGSLTWDRPSYSEYQQLARESEYAAWTLVNGYALNHVTISVHQLKSHLRSIESLNEFLEKNGFKLNSEGGVLKVSPDGLLQQSSTVADSMPFSFSDGATEPVSCSYIEFAERLVLPQFQNLPDSEVKEFHRRNGFEVGNADKIFESTSKEQLTRRSA